MAYASKLKALYDAWLETLPQDRVMIVDEDEGFDLADVLRFLEE